MLITFGVRQRVNLKRSLLFRTEWYMPCRIRFSIATCCAAVLVESSRSPDPDIVAPVLCCALRISARNPAPRCTAFGCYSRVYWTCKDVGKPKATWNPPGSFERSTNKFWVHPHKVQAILRRQNSSSSLKTTRCLMYLMSMTVVPRCASTAT